jgi:2-methylcitrate dehydratase PrpD
VTGATLADELARFAAETTFERLPEAVVDSTRQRVLDTLGICLAAAAQGLGDGVADLVGSAAGREEASLVGRPGRYPAPQAALVNGTLAHSLDFDDTHLPSVLHPSASSVPAALAMAQATGRSGAEAIAAAAIAIELTVRIGMGGYLPDAGNVWFERGWHATSICGTLGAAAAGGRLLGLDATGVRDALGIAASMAGGVIEANRAGGTVKRLHCGWAAHSGLTAALLAQHGYTGPPSVFEGRFGLFEAFLNGRFDPDAVLAGLGERWELPGIFFKPYPANHYTHAGIDAALALRAEHGLRVSEIESVTLGLPKSGMLLIGEPAEKKADPRNVVDGQFSGPFVIACALAKGHMGWDSYALLDDPDIRSLLPKVRCELDPEIEAQFPANMSGKVTVRARGRDFTRTVAVPKGEPANFLTEAELRGKFSGLADAVLGAERAARLADAVLAIDRTQDVSSLMRLAAPTTATRLAGE